MIMIISSSPLILHVNPSLYDRVTHRDTEGFTFSYCQETGASSSNSEFDPVSNSEGCVNPSLISSCEECVQQREQRLHSHSSGSYLWNLNEQYCMVSDMTGILDSSHLGNVVSKVESCLLNCSVNKQVGLKTYYQLPKTQS